MNNNNSTHIYVDLDVINNDYVNPPPLLKFEDTRSSPFLQDSKDYDASIIRFSLQTSSSLPVFIPKMDKTASNINTTIYKITFVYTKTRTSPLTPITYTRTLNVMFKNNLVKYSDVSTPPYNYYYIYNYLDFIKLINETFDLLMNDNNIFSEVSSFTSNFFSPFMEIDPNTFKCSIPADKNFFRK